MEVDCAKVAVRIGGIREEALLDSCASVSLISLELVNKHGLSIKNIVSTEIVSIFGSTTTIIGKSTFGVRIGPRTYNCQALVLENSMHPLLLGLDWLLANRCKLNFERRLLEFPNGFRKPISIEKDRALPVRSKLEVVLQAGERALIPAKIPDLYDVSDIEGIAIGLKDKETPWKIAKSILRVKEGITMVEIINVGQGPWKVRKNEQVGLFEYEPKCANMPLIASAIVMEDVPLNGNSGIGLRKEIPHRPKVAGVTRALNPGLPQHKNRKRFSQLQQENLIKGLFNTRNDPKIQKDLLAGINDLTSGRKVKMDRINEDQKSWRRIKTFVIKEAKVLNPGGNKFTEEELLNVIGHLQKPKQLQLKALLLQYQSIFAVDNSQPGTTNVIRHEIDTGENQPISQAPYRSNPEKRKEIQRQVQGLLDAGQIEESSSPWSSPVLLVPKKDGGWRMCVDYRKVNAVTKKVSYPIPRTEDTFDYLLQAKWFSKMDAASGFWQVPVEETSREKTAMITPDGLFQWKVMPFGLCNAPATFQRLMDVVLSGLKWKECLVYLDDILIFSKDWDEHLLHLRHVFEKLEKARISLKLSKCEFAKNEIQFLGHIVKDQQLLPDEHNVEAVLKFPIPKDLTGIRGFLGLVGHYRRFIPKFADKSMALRKLLKKDENFHWGLEQQQAFDELRQVITAKPVLGLPDFAKPFKLSTDASNIGISAILSQIDEDGKELYVIGYRSRALRGAEENYSTIEKEMLAIVYGLQKFDYYLMGTALPFEIVTDHQPLCHLPTTKDPYGRIGRWALLLQGYNYKIRHLPGQQNVVADVLSRFFAQENVKISSGENNKPGSDEIQQRLQELVFVNLLRVEDSLEPEETLIPSWFENISRNSTTKGDKVVENTMVTTVQARKEDWFHHWKLNPKVFKIVDDIWGPLHTDLFATSSNRQLERFYSKEEEDLSSGKDSFSQIWEVNGCYANPPWNLLERTIRRIREERLKVVVISPYWPNSEWFRMAIKICVCPPILLGRYKKLYLMENGEHRAPAKWSSMAWLLDGSIEGVENWKIGDPINVLNWDDSEEPRLLSPEDIEEKPKFNRVDFNKPYKPSLEPVLNQRLAKSTFLDLQEQDPGLLHAFEELKKDDLQDDERNFIIHEGRLCRIIKEEIIPGITKPTMRLVIPRQIRKSVVYACHDDIVAGHLGYKRTLLRIQQRYWWPKMTNDVRWYIKTCRKCQFSKREQGPKGGPLNPLPPRNEPFEVIGMDLIFPMPKSKDGNVAILVWEDYATRWSEAIPLADTLAATIGRAFWYNVVCRYGCPRTILTDLGKNFMSSIFEELLRFTKTDRLRTTAYHPQTDGLVERQNQTLKQMIRTYVNKKQSDWDELLPYLSFAYNSSVHSTTGVTPYFLLYGREATLPVDVAMDWIPDAQLNRGIHEKMMLARKLAQENLIASQQDQKNRYDKRHGEANKFNIGDIVMVRTEFVTRGRKKSIAPRFSQLAKVVAISPGNVYKLRLGPKTYSWINVERMKRFYPGTEGNQGLDAWLRTKDELLPVDEVVDVKDVEDVEDDGDSEEEDEPSNNGEGELEFIPDEEDR